MKYSLRCLYLILQTQKAHQVAQFQILNWNRDGICDNLKTVTDVTEDVAKVQRRTGNKSIVVHCRFVYNECIESVSLTTPLPHPLSDTATRSGLFCAIATTIDRCKTEGVVDVFQVVKALRVHKPGAVPSLVSQCMIPKRHFKLQHQFSNFTHQIVNDMLKCMQSMFGVRTGKMMLNKLSLFN